jgi:hypothetical protein
VTTRGGFLLLALILAVYAPYVARGGLLRDDLGFATASRDFPSYTAFQGHLSSFKTMTARPFSAVLHGTAYWFLGASPHAHHALNLSLFAASVILVYLALARHLGPGWALLTGALAAVYPAASGTVFSAMMMNSNLAAACWATALWLASARPPRMALATGFLMLSGLSYESFVPLFPAVSLAAWSGLSTRGRLLRSTAPLLVVVAGLGLYRFVLERAVFHTTFTRASLPSHLIERAGLAWLDGARVALVDSVQVSIHALRNLSLAPWPELVVLVIVTGLILAWLSRVRGLGSPDADSIRLILCAALGLFLAAQVIFLFSDYRPTARGFENRTQGAIRFATAFLLASALVALAGARPRWARLAGRACTLTLLGLFTLGTVGQREGWIAAAQYNQEIVAEIGQAIRDSGIGDRQSLTIVAVIDRPFVHSVNAEPIFRTSWDLGPALELAYPGLRVRANVYEPKRATVDRVGITLDGDWTAPFPFRYFRTGEPGLRWVRSEQEWAGLATERRGAVSLKHSPRPLECET